MNKYVAISGDTYHNRYSPDSPYKGNKKYKKKAKKCAHCGTTTGPFDLHHTNNSRSDLKSGKGLIVLCRSCHRKLHAKLNGGKGEFFVSYAARIIDDPKSENSIALASQHKDSDLLHVEFILCHADVNQNKDCFTEEDLHESASTANLKPINWEHSNDNIGTIYESEYVEVKSLNDEAKAYFSDIDPLEKDFVVCRAAIWAYKHPEKANEIKERADAKKLFFSMENKFAKAECSVCKEIFSSSFEYCDHLLYRRKIDGAHRIFIDSNFVGAAVTKNPADIYAGTLAIASIEDDELNVDEIYEEIEEGGNEVEIQNTPEFKEAVAKAKEEILEKVQSGNELKELNDKIAKAEEEKAKIDKEKAEALAAIEEEKKKIAIEFDNFKKETIEKELAVSRMAQLAEKGFLFEKSGDFVSASVAKMNEEAYASFCSVLEELATATKEAAEAANTEVNKEEDPVKESNETAIASKTNDEVEKKEKFSAIDNVLKRALS